MPAPASTTTATISHTHHRLPPSLTFPPVEADIEDILSESTDSISASEELSVDAISSEETTSAEEISLLEVELFEIAAAELVLTEDAADDVLVVPP